MFHGNLYICYIKDVIGPFLVYVKYTRYYDLQSSRTRKHHCKQYFVTMDLLPDTWNCGLHMRGECWERFSRHRLQRRSLVSDLGMHHGTRVTHVPWYLSWSLTRGGGGGRTRSRHSQRMRNPQFYVSSTRPMYTAAMYICVFMMTGNEWLICCM